MIKKPLLLHIDPIFELRTNISSYVLKPLDTISIHDAELNIYPSDPDDTVVALFPFASVTVTVRKSGAWELNSVNNGCQPLTCNLAVLPVFTVSFAGLTVAGFVPTILLPSASVENPAVAVNAPLSSTLPLLVMSSVTP
jgi:hypothetical protein